MQTDIYTSIFDKTVKVKVTQVDEDTVINSKEFGDILITKGNYVLEYADGTQVGTTKTDLDARYKKSK